MIKKCLLKRMEMVKQNNLEWFFALIIQKDK